MTEQRIGSYEKKWRPTKDFFLTNPRSAQLRGICLSIVHNLDALIHDPEVVQSDAYAQLEALNGQLIELGVRLYMQEGLPQEIYSQNPVIYAEWFAGQIIRLTGVHIVSESEIVPIRQEFSQVQTPEGVSIIESSESLPQKLNNFIDMRTEIVGAYSALGAEEELADFWKKYTRK